MKNFRQILIFSIFIVLFIKLNIVLWANNAPDVVCDWLPWCWNENNWDDDSFFQFLWNVISEMINYAAVFSVISLVFAWLNYVFSFWEDEKIKKSKTWILWSLVWVFITVSAWSIINLLNLFSIK